MGKCYFCSVKSKSNITYAKLVIFQLATKKIQRKFNSPWQHDLRDSAEKKQSRIDDNFKWIMGTVLVDHGDGSHDPFFAEYLWITGTVLVIHFSPNICAFLRDVLILHPVCQYFAMP